VVELRCAADLDSKSGGPTSSRKIKRHNPLVSAQHAIDVEARLYDRLFTVPEPDAEGDFKAHLNPNSLEVVTAKCEPSMVYAARPPLSIERLATSLSTPIPTSSPHPSQRKLVFNRTIR